MLPDRPASADQLSAALLAWYDRHRRDLPWRAPAGTKPDPYKVWLSEIMLQQTTVAAVRDYFRKFLLRWPTVTDLAAAPLEDVLKAWAGLGYYARARNLHKCAGIVARHHGGRFPDEFAVLKSLPGIGEYTAGAIAAIAFDQPHVAVDGNVERVMARLFAIETPLPDAKPALKGLASGLVPARRPGDFAQALMDLGATICAPRKANCLICPWSAPCKARALGIAETLPRKREKLSRPVRHGTAFLVTRADGAVLLRRRAERGLLGGMLEVPSTPWAAKPSAVPTQHAPMNGPWRPVAGRVEHTFTHFHLIMEVWHGEAKETQPPPDESYRWVASSALAGEALPSIMRKIIAHGLG
ncbi:A/G-specific adenine glycosylase [Rhodoligotrophos defluvii]|uniref:A/G-specific adenine glycosylase n=1 Tax=Rhodoligotrophos defluvii TaxID=2561934 RepID=UPI0010C98526|nr:A/G-specific adenine glycosylase [Rhodoligotrophos defluvii]